MEGPVKRERWAERNGIGFGEQVGADGTREFMKDREGASDGDQDG